MFKKIFEVYLVLIDLDKRRIFDSYGEEGFKNECGGFGFFLFIDFVYIFCDVFGNDFDFQFLGR